MLMRPVVLILVVALGLTACSTNDTGATDTGNTGSDVSTASLSELASDALRETPGEPLVDPAAISIGAGFDAIPSVDDPVVVSAERADSALAPTEQVMLFEHDGQARAYPVRSLIRHEIVNDIVAGLPVAVTWCPLCNTGITFDRRVEGRAEVFGVSGGLYRSALVMFDRRTTSLWPQPLGTAVLGPLLGAELEVLASSLLPWGEVLAAHPDVTVALGDESELQVSRNPYVGYDRSSSPFLFDAELDDRLPPFERVAGVELDDEAVAWSYGLLRERRVVEASVGGQPLLVLWAPGSASPLDDADVRGGRDVGSAAVFAPSLDGRMLSFEPAGDGAFRDVQTGSTWSITGRATAGPLVGERLEPVPHQNAFWFAWAAFQPGTTLLMD